MSKRLTDTELWKKPWFRKLDPEYKCFWSYVLSNCDFVGVWEVDFDHASFSIGKQIDPALARNLFSEKIFLIENSQKWVVKNFLKFQYGETLNEKSPVHKKILQLLQKHEIEYNPKNNTLSDTLCHRGKEEEEVKEEVKVKEGEKEREKEKVKEKILILPFNSEAFSNAWHAWITYKETQHKFRYKTLETEQIALKELAEKAKNHEQTAIGIIQQSIANGWKGFFELKTETQNGKQNSKNNDQSGEAVKEWFKRKYGV